MALFIYDEHGKRRVASAEEYAKFEAEERERKFAWQQQQFAMARASRAERKRVLKVEKRGLGSKHTRATLPWKLQRRSLGLVRYLELKPTWRRMPDGTYEPGPADFEFCAPGQPSLRDIKPVLTHSQFARYDAIAVSKDNGKLVARLIRGDFKRDCNGEFKGDQHCERDTCARCWTIANATIHPNETIEVVEHFVRGKLNDPAGVHPAGKPHKGVDMGEDQRAMWALTSTQHRYKDSAAEQGVNALTRKTTDHKR